MFYTRLVQFTFLIFFFIFHPNVASIYLIKVSFGLGTASELDYKHVKKKFFYNNKMKNKNHRKNCPYIKYFVSEEKAIIYRNTLQCLESVIFPLCPELGLSSDWQ